MGTAPRKLCDSCKSSTATLFCRPDSAFLCSACDSQIHACNKLASRHARVTLCEVCEHAPAHVTCKADAATLCVTCDHDIHSANPLASRHHRVDVVPFFSDAGDDAEAASWLVSNPNSIGAKNAGFDMYAAEMEDPYLDLEYGVMVKEEVDFVPATVPAAEECDGVVPGGGGGSVFADACFDMDFGGSKTFDHFYNSSSSNNHDTNNGPQHSITQSLSSSSHDVGVVPDACTMIDVSNALERSQYNTTTTITDSSINQAVQLTGVDREARVSRYREKRKNRKFEKTIRYASRKAYAETRPRIKGRFAKRTEMEAEVDQIYGYGIVPSF